MIEAILREAGSILIAASVLMWAIYQTARKARPIVTPPLRWLWRQAFRDVNERLEDHEGRIGAIEEIPVIKEQI